MKIAILETGLPPMAIRADWPRYPVMFERLMSPAAPDMTFHTIPVTDDARMPDPGAFDGYLITGSPAGVYEDHPWMQPLLGFIRATAAAGKPQIGICFGHQAIAQAMGGEVIKSPKGWGIGRHVYQMVDAPGWVDDAPTTFAMAVSHQDQVVAPPPGARVFARSDFCEFAGLYDPQARTLSLQGHPEFDADYSLALYNIRRGTALTTDQVDTAEASLQKPLSNPDVARWMAAFFRSAR